MGECLLALLACTPIVLGALLGRRLGAGRLLSAGGPVVLGWAVGVAAAIAAFKLGWFHPFGLMTPLVPAVLCAALARRLVRDRVADLARTGSAQLPAMVRQAAGCVLGGACGLCVSASLWLALLFAAGWTEAPRQPRVEGTEAPAGSGGVLQAIFRTANRGFIRHLPLAGPLGDEVEALGFILNTDEELRARLARQAGWERLAELPAGRAVIEDERIGEEIERIRRGEITAIYRLQRNPRIVAFLEEEEVQKLVSEIRPTHLARQLADLAGRPRRRD